MLKERTATGTSNPYLASRSKRRNLGAEPNGKASRSCWTIHRLVGCLVTLNCRMRRRSWLMMKKPETEIYCGDGEEVHRGDGFLVVAKKGKPALAKLRILRSSFHPTGNRSFGDV